MTPSVQDITNAGFELTGAALNLLNIRALLRDKVVRGVSIAPTVIFTLWGLWNVFFYSYLAQPVSLYAGMFMALVNAAWVGLALYYSFPKTVR